MAKYLLVELVDNGPAISGNFVTLPTTQLKALLRSNINTMTDRQIYAYSRSLRLAKMKIRKVLYENKNS